jgi:hypothetical protein
MTYYIKNIIDGICDTFSYLFVDENDFIEELVLNDCKCYLTGNALCSKLFNFWYGFIDNVIDRDIYVENIHPKDLMRILIKYGNVYVYGVKNYNFRKSQKNIRFYLIPYVGDTSYEFTFKADYGALINSMTHRVYNKFDIENINFTKIMEITDIFEIIEKRTWENNDEIEFFKKFENIMRCFELCLYYDLKLNKSTIDNIKKSVKNIIKNKINYSKEIVYEELVKIINMYDNEIILNIMYDTDCFILMNMKFSNFEKTINEMNKIDVEYDIVRFIKLLDGLETDNLKRWCISNDINKVKNITNNIKRYYIFFDNYEEYLKINTVYDMLKFITNMNKHIIFDENYLNLFNYYISNIKLMEFDQDKYNNLYKNCELFPVSIKDIKITSTEINNKFNIEWSDIKKLKENLLELIHKMELSNNYEDIIIHLENNYIITQ